MIDLTHNEAILFRVLAGLFGIEQVIPNMSAISVCGGNLPERLVWPKDELLARKGIYPIDPIIWARNNKCLFTIVDQNDCPCMVIEFSSDFTHTVDLVALEHKRFMEPLLSAAGIKYITISSEEFADILDPSSSLDLVTLLQAKVESLDSSNS